MRGRARIRHMPTRWAHFRLREELYEQAQKVAEADRRSLSNWFALVVERALEDESREPAEQSARPALFQRQRTRCALPRGRWSLPVPGLRSVRPGSVQSRT